jgi:hypothetical protein
VYIQDAIDEASSGDEIIVYPGTYYESLDFQGKHITVRGSDPNNWDIVAATVIDANGVYDGVLFDSNEGGNSVLTGLTIRGAVYGIDCNSSSPTISKCIIRDNSEKGIFGNLGAPTVINNKICNNGTQNIALYRSATNTIIRNNVIYDANYGIFLYYPLATVTISNNTIVRNAKFGIVRASGSYSPTITNCIVWDCNNDISGSGCSVTYSCIQDGDGCGQNGNICSDPCFVDADNNDFHLNPYSPCVDTGNSNGNYNGQTDIDGDSRMQNGGVDIGADEIWQGVYNLTADEWYVYIQDAIDEASSGDDIVVYPGTYYESLDFQGKHITVRGSDPNNWDTVAATVLDANGHMMEFCLTQTKTAILY